MKVILSERIPSLGQVGDTVSVKPGYGRNWLIPMGKAIPATAANKAKFEAKRAQFIKAAEEKLQLAQQRAEKLSNMIITIVAKAGEEGKLYGSLRNQDVATAISNAGVTVVKNEVRLLTGVLRHLGEYEILLQLHHEVSVAVKVVIVPEN